MDKSRKINLVMNSLKVDKTDPTKVHFSMSILDAETSQNNVKVGANGMISLANSVKGMPLVTKLIKNDKDRSMDDFGDHEVYMGKDRDGNDSLERDTIAIGAFTSEGYIEKQTIDGNEVDVLMGDGVLWASRYPDIVNLISEMFEEGIKLNTSSEYKYKDFTFDEDNVEIHDGDLYFEGIAVLGSNYNYVAPAYESATFTSLNESQVDKFNLLVAQAINNTEGEKEDLKTQTNKVSFDYIRRETESQIKSYLTDVEYLWVNDVTTEDVVIATEFNSGYENYQFKYSMVNDEVVVDLESKIKVTESREWKIVTNTLETKVSELETKLNEVVEGKQALESKVDELSTGKEELANQLNEANDVIVKLNETVAELTAVNAELAPFKEQVELSQKESKVAEVSEAFEAKFNAMEGQEVFKSEEVQALLLNAVEDGEVGLNAKLKLNEKVLELASAKLEKSPSVNQMLNSNKKRDFKELVKDDTDILASLR